MLPKYFCTSKFKINEKMKILPSIALGTWSWGEALAQLAFYAGWPKLISASLVVKEVYDGQKK